MCENLREKVQIKARVRREKQHLFGFQIKVVALSCHHFEFT